MFGLLTWTTFGAWLPGPARGQVDPGRIAESPDLPEPDESLSARRRRSLKWPPRRLGPDEQRVVLEDLQRIAALRDFDLHAAAAASDHVHVLLSFDDDRDSHRLVQLIKGALSRALTVSTGDREAGSLTGRPLPHHKWWPRQYSLIRIENPEIERGMVDRLREHAAQGAAVYVAQHADN
jgi:REP element-mobilizing transposase RayT